jgi:hypothetical protein
VKEVSHSLRAWWKQTGTIANGQQLSTAIDLRYAGELGLVIPAAFTGTAVTFEVSVDNVTFQPLYGTDGNAVSVTVAQGRSYVLPSAVVPWPWVKIKSGSSEAGTRSVIVTIKG